jgi:transcription initiation factor IIE alpha subunit
MMFPINVVEKIKMHILCSVIFFVGRGVKNHAVYEIMWKNRVRQATDGNMAHAQCILDKAANTYMLRLCNAYCFSTATGLHKLTSILHYTYVACLVMS